MVVSLEMLIFGSLEAPRIAEIVPRGTVGRPAASCSVGVVGSRRRAWQPRGTARGRGCRPVAAGPTFPESAWARLRLHGEDERTRGQDA